MKIKVETFEEVFLFCGDTEIEKMFGICLPFLKKIAELEEKNEALEEKNKELGNLEGTEKINESLRKENLNLLEKLHNNEGIQNKISKLKNVFQSIKKEITLETLYGKIKEIGDLIDSDLSEQIKLIKTTDENYREVQQQIKTLRWDKERIEIQWVQLQKENERKDNIIKSMEKNSTDLIMSNEELREKLSKSEDTNRKLSGELINQTEEIHMLEEEIDSLKSENEDLNRQIQEVKKWLTKTGF